MIWIRQTEGICGWQRYIPLQPKLLCLFSNSTEEIRTKRSLKKNDTNPSVKRAKVPRHSSDAFSDAFAVKWCLVTAKDCLFHQAQPALTWLMASMYIDLSKANSATVCHLSSLRASCKSCCKCRRPIGWKENKPGGIIGPIQQICKVWFEALETSKISQHMTYNKSVPLTTLCFKTQRDLLQQWWDA